jgi:hypothetical protein
MIIAIDSARAERLIASSKESSAACRGSHLGCRKTCSGLRGFCAVADDTAGSTKGFSSASRWSAEEATVLQFAGPIRVES